MIFNAPQFLWALGLAAIPIIIHLFQFKRYKKLYFPDVSLLKEVKARSQTKNQLKHLLILLSRIAFVALLVFAFAEPVIPAKEGQSIGSDGFVSFYLDNSFSMQGESIAGDNLQKGIQSVFDVASSMPASTKFQLITNDFASTSRTFVDLARLTTLLDEVEPSYHHRTINDVLEFQSRTLSPDQESELKTYLISDFNQVLDSTVRALDSNRLIAIIPLFNQTEENLAIDSAWLTNPITQVGIEQQLNFRIHNYGRSPFKNLKVEVYLDERLVASPLLDIEPQQFVDTSVSLLPEVSGGMQGRLVINDYPIEYDNQYFFTIDVWDEVPIVAIQGPNVDFDPFKRLFGSKEFDYRSLDEGQLQLDSMQDAQLLVLNGLEEWTSGTFSICMDLLERGGNVLLIPASKPSTSFFDGVANDFALPLGGWDTTRLEVNRLAETNVLFKDVFESRQDNMNFPSVNGHFKLAAASYDEALLTLYNGDPLLAEKTIGSGKLYVCTSPLQNAYTNFHRHALFVPAMINAAVKSGIAKPIAYTVGTSSIRARFDVEELRMIRLQDSATIIPAMNYNSLILGDQMPGEGHYLLRDKSRNTLATYGFNYDRSESQLRSLSIDEIAARFEEAGITITTLEAYEDDLNQTVSASSLSTQLWPLFIAFALLFLIIETVLLKRFGT